MTFKRAFTLCSTVVGLAAALLALGVPVPTFNALKDIFIVDRNCRLEGSDVDGNADALKVDGKQYKIINGRAGNIPLHIFTYGDIDIDIRCRGHDWDMTTLQVTYRTCRILSKCG